MSSFSRTLSFSFSVFSSSVYSIVTKKKQLIEIQTLGDNANIENDLMKHSHSSNIPNSGQNNNNSSISHNNITVNNNNTNTNNVNCNSMLASGETTSKCVTEIIPEIYISSQSISNRNSNINVHMLPLITRTAATPQGSPPGSIMGPFFPFINDNNNGNKSDSSHSLDLSRYSPVKITSSSTNTNMAENELRQSPRQSMVCSSNGSSCF